jgi:anti-anti-sigma factor
VQEHDQDTLVLTVHGEIDLGTAPTLREALKPILDRQTGPVVVDLSEVAFMDSTGVL